jgi:hypothetical protein
MRDDQTLRPGASFLLSTLFVGLSAAYDSIVGFDSKPIDTGGAAVTGTNDGHVFVGVAHGNAASGISVAELGHSNFAAGAGGAPDQLVFGGDSHADLSGASDNSKAAAGLSDGPTAAPDNHQIDDDATSVPPSVFTSLGSGDSIVSLDFKQTANGGDFGAAELGNKLSLVSYDNAPSEISISDIPPSISSRRGIRRHRKPNARHLYRLFGRWVRDRHGRRR